MSTIPTQNPVPSEAAKDLKFNSGKIDEFVTSMKNKYIDRFGQEHFTIEGLRWAAQQAISQFGYITLDSFQKGAEITLPNQVLRDEATGEYYRWDGVLPKSVPIDSTPDSSGGIGAGKWLSVGDATLRSELASNKGASLIGFMQQNLYQKMSLFIDVRDFGAKLNGVDDDTKSIQAAIDFVGCAGGGVVYWPAGKALISMKESFHPYSCLIIPANVELLGAGKFSTLITRPDDERETDGVLMCNKNYDVNTLYSADGNIIIRHIGLDDGAHNRHRGLGDLIGFGNGDGLLVEHCYFGNHDQHAIDICKSRNVIVCNNVSKNKVNMPESATYQIDGGLIWGIAGGVTPSYNVFIYGNDIQESHANMVIHFHGENAGNNIHVFDNDMDLTMLPDNSNAIAGDTDISYKDVYIHNNRIKLNNKTCRGINFPVTQGKSFINNMRIYDNKISGVFRIGIFAGDDNIDYTKHSDINDVYIYGNTLNVDLTGYSGLPVRLISASGNNKAKIFNNTINVEVNDSFPSGMAFIEDRDNKIAEIFGNRVYQNGDGLFNATSAILTTIAKLDAAGIEKDIYIDDNKVDGVNCDYHIEVRDPKVSESNYTPKISGSIRNNTLTGLVKLGNIYEVVPLSDGSNNLRYVNFSNNEATSESEFIKFIEKGKNYKKIPLTGSKRSKAGNSKGSGINIKVIYSPINISGFSNDVEDIQTSISGSSCVGTFIKDINLPEGFFDIVTGGAGVSFAINDASFLPVYRENGYIKILCGI
ncbi:TPA: hypothetical protein QIM55_001907 [Proteus mirabilis]|nr:hypothetical protein [Proteus mirabilis]